MANGVGTSSCEFEHRVMYVIEEATSTKEICGWSQERTEGLNMKTRTKTTSMQKWTGLTTGNKGQNWE